MEHYAAIDVSLEWSSVCMVDAAGQIVREAKVQSEREALVAFFEQSGLRFARIGLEAGPLSQWLHARLIEAGLPAICIETRHVKAALKAMTVKTDKNDARGMAQLMHMGWFRPVHVKAPVVQEIRALLTARKLLVAKLRDVEGSLRGLLRGFGLKVGAVSRGAEARGVVCNPVRAGGPPGREGLQEGSTGGARAEPPTSRLCAPPGAERKGAATWTAPSPRAGSDKWGKVSFRERSAFSSSVFLAAPSYSLS